MANCLVIIDAQDGYIDRFTCNVINKITNLVQSDEYRFNHIVATRFFNLKNSPYMKTMGWSGMSSESSQVLQPKIAEISEKVFTRYNYSCFTDDFIHYLNDNDIDKLYFTGFNTESSILQSAVEALERGIMFEVYANYCASYNGLEVHHAALKVLRQSVGKHNVNLVT